MEVSDVSPALRERLGVEATVGLLRLFDTARQEWTGDVTTAAVERFEARLIEETARLGLEIAEFRASLQAEIAALRQESTTEFAALRQENLEGRIELLKWCFAFWVGQVFAVAGVVAVVLRLMRT
jgi:hypothetical protein